MKPTPSGWPRIASAVYYEDAPAAIDWLCRAFGFAVRVKIEGEGGSIMPGLDELWDAIGRVKVPLLLVRGSTSPVVDDADVADLKRRKPDAEVVVVEGSGHSVQGDKPRELAEILRRLL